MSLLEIETYTVEALQSTIGGMDIVEIIVPGPVGGVGPVGPAGPQGAPGPPGLSNAAYSSRWNWSNNIGLPPSSQQVRGNAADWATLTALHFAGNNADNVDVSAFLSRVVVGDDIYMQQKTEASIWARWNVDSVTDNGTYFSYGVTLLEGSGTTPGGVEVGVSFLTEGMTAAQWYTGPSAPAASLGKPNDMYLEGDGDVWKSSSVTGWTATGTNIRGPIGPAGAAGTVSAAGAGTAALPSISFAADPNTGFWNPAADTIGLTTGGNSVSLVAEAANVLALRSGTSKQESRLYWSYTDASNWSRVSHTFGTGSQYEIKAEQAGTGPAWPFQLSSLVHTNFATGNPSTVRWRITELGHLLSFPSDNAYDIGASGTNRPRTIYAGTSVVTPLEQATNLQVGPQLSLGATPATPDVFLARDAANALGMRNGTTAQALAIYNTFGDIANYEKVYFSWSGNTAFLLSHAAGTGVARPFIVGTQGAADFSIRTSNATRWIVQAAVGHLIAFPDNANDIGIAGSSRPRSLYLGTSLVTPQVGFNTGTSAADLFLVRDGSNNLAQRNGVSQQAFHVYRTFTDSSNYERLTFGPASVAGGVGAHGLQVQQAGTGAVRALALGTLGASNIYFQTVNADRWVIGGQGGNEGILWPSTTNVYDIGSSALRPKTIYAGTSVITPQIQADTHAWGQTTPDVFLVRETANQLAQRNGTNQQRLLLYNTFTDSANYQRLIFTPDAIATQAAGTGLPGQALTIGTNVNTELHFRTNLISRWIVQTAGHFVAALDNAYDIGVSGAVRPRNIYAATSVVTPLVQSIGASILTLNGAGIDFMNGGTLLWQITSGGTLLRGSDNTSDIGAVAAGRPRTIYAGTSVVSPQFVPTAKATVSGSRGANAALASLLTALAGYGLVTDSSTA